MKRIFIRYVNFLLALIVLASCAGYGTQQVRINSNQACVIYSNNGTGPFLMEEPYKSIDMKLDVRKYAKGKKRYYATAPGYKPVKFRVHGKFNPTVFWYFLFPPGFAWAPYVVLNPKKPNNIAFTRRAERTAKANYDLGMLCVNWREKRDYMKKAIMQDPLNKQGVAVDAARELMDIDYRHKSRGFDKACETVLAFAPNDEMAVKYRTMKNYDIDFLQKGSFIKNGFAKAMDKMHIEALVPEDRSARRCLWDANSAKLWRKKKRLLVKAISLDSDNEEGIALQASHQLLDVGYKHSGKTLRRAYGLSCYYNPNDQLAERYYAMRMEKERRKEERTNAILSGLSAAGSALNSVASTIPSKSTSTNVSTYSSSNSLVSNNTQSSTSNSSTQSTRTKTTSTKEQIEWMQAGSIYDDYDSQLARMQTRSWPYQDGFKDSDRIRIQKEMKRIREKWQKKGYHFTKLSREDWDGK